MSEFMEDMWWDAVDSAMSDAAEEESDFGDFCESQWSDEQWEQEEADYLAQLQAEADFPHEPEFTAAEAYGEMMMAYYD